MSEIIKTEESTENVEQNTNELEKVIGETIEKHLSKFNTPINKKSFLSTEESDNKFIETRKALAELINKRTPSINALVSKSMSIGTPSAGGYLTNDEFGEAVIRFANDSGIARKGCDVKKMNSDRKVYPKISTELTAYVVGEGASITSSDLAVTQVILDAKKIATLTSLTNELDADSKVSYDAVVEIIENAGKKIGEYEDSLLFKGSSTFTGGIYTTSGIGTLTASVSGNFTNNATALKADLGDKLSEMIATVESANTEYVKNAAFYMSPTIKHIVRTIKNSDGDYIFNQGNPNLGFPDTIFGYPVITNRQLFPTSTTTSGTKYICFGDLKNVFMGDRQIIQIFLAQEGSVNSDSLLQKDMSAVRVIERIDFQVKYPDAFCTYQIQ